MSTKAIIAGAPIDVSEALRTMRPGWLLHVTGDPITLMGALDELQACGHEVTEDPRLRHKVLLELVPRDVQRLRLLESSDRSHVLGAARRVIHEHLDQLITTPACTACAHALSHPDHPRDPAMPPRAEHPEPGDRRGTEEQPLR